MMSKIGIKKALTCSRLISINGRHNDLKFLISRWNVESNTSCGSVGEFGPTFEDAAVLTAIYGDTNAMGLILSEDEK